MLSISMFVLIRDSKYKYSSNKVTSFFYSEGYSDVGYDVYEVEVEDDGIYATHNFENENSRNNWSRTKYLNFNEALYESEVLGFETCEKEYTVSDDFEYRIEIYFENGENFILHNSGEVPKDTEKFKELIEEYFDGDIKI